MPDRETSPTPRPSAEGGLSRIFLSYARGDDEPFVKRLQADLTQAGFTVWFDRESLMSRGLSFHQEIKDAIRTEVDRVVYVGGPKAALALALCGGLARKRGCDFHSAIKPRCSVLPSASLTGGSTLNYVN